MKKTLLTLSLFTFGLAQVNRMHAQAPALPNDPFFHLQWSHKNNGNVPVFNSSGTCGAVSFDLDILPAWLNLDSRKLPVDIIHVGILDSGLDPTHPDMLQSRILAGKNFTANNYTGITNNTADVLGHGTIVTGAIAATANNNIGIAGIDRTCKVMPILIDPACSIGQRGHLARAIRYAADNNIKVINMSWGWDEKTIDLKIREAISYAIAKGCMFVGAAGNDNATNVDFPAKAVIAVGAANPCGSIKSGIPPLSCEYDTRPEGNQLHWGSNTGVGLDVMGPGTMLPAIDLQAGAGYSSVSCPTPAISSCYHSDATGNYLKDAYGTSIASPYIAGIVSQMLSVKPGLKMHEVEYLLKASTKTMQDGYRWPNAESAITLAGQFVLGSRPLADLAVTGVKYERLGPSMVRATVVVRNHSNSVGSPISSLDVYTSNNDTNSHADNWRAGTTVSIPALSPGASYTSTVTFQDPNDFLITGAQKLWLNAIVDPAMTLEETDDANNARNVEVARKQVLADLIVSGLAAVSVSGGKQVTCKIKNISDYPAYFPSNRAIVSFLEYVPATLPVHVHTINSVSSFTVNPQQEITYTVIFSTSKTHLMAHVDPTNNSIFPNGVITEVNEGNNTYTISLQGLGMEEEMPGDEDEENGTTPGQTARKHKSEATTMLPSDPELQLELFPNPSSDDVFMVAELPGRGQVQITDLLGNSLYTYDFVEGGKQQLRFDATGLSRGIYIVKLSQIAGRSITKKLMIR